MDIDVLGYITLTMSHSSEDKPRKKSEPIKYSDDSELNDAIMEFIKFRKDIKKPMSNRAITLTLNKLESLSHDKHEQVLILNQFIMQGGQAYMSLSLIKAEASLSN